MNNLVRGVCAALVAMGLTAASSARADLIIDAGQPEPAAAPAARPVPSAAPAASVSSSPAAPAGRLKDTGKPPAPVAVLEGWGDGVELELALRQVLPTAWTLRFEGVDPAKIRQNVSWSGGRPWTEVLQDLARKVSLDAHLNWSLHEAVITRPGAQLIAAAGVLPIRQAPVAPPAVQWVIDPKKTLKENVEAWAVKAKWNRVVWEAADYPIVAPASFEGTFDAEDGPLAQLIGAFDRSDQPLRVRLSTRDKVVHVTNRNYQPVVVEPQTSQAVSPQSFR